MTVWTTTRKQLGALRSDVVGAVEYLRIRSPFDEYWSELKTACELEDVERPSLLILHPGYSNPRHYNCLDAIAMLLSKQLGVPLELNVLSCGGALEACGFVTFFPGDDGDRRTPSAAHCKRCVQRHTKRFSNSLYNHVFLTDEIDAAVRATALSIVAALGPRITALALRNLRVADVQVGDLVIESIQRSLRKTTNHEYRLAAGSVVFNYVHAGVLYALAADRVFAKRRYSLALGNEISYIDWGIPARFALKHGVPYVHLTHHYPGEGYLVLQKHVRAESLSKPAFVPTREVIEGIRANAGLATEYMRKGRKYFEGWTKRVGTGDPPGQLERELGPRFDPRRKSVAVFTHLCWDSAGSIGDSHYPSFEAWLADVVEIAKQRRDINWIFKIHPSEGGAETSQTSNTTTFMRDLVEGQENMFLLEAGSRVSAKMLMPHIIAGLTALGTVSIELAVSGVPSLLCTKKGYAELSFTCSAVTLEAYRSALLQIDTLPPLTQEMRDEALITLGVSFDKNSYVNISPLFKSKALDDRRIDPEKFAAWYRGAQLFYGFNTEGK